MQNNSVNAGNEQQWTPTECMRLLNSMFQQDGFKDYEKIFQHFESHLSRFWMVEKQIVLVKKFHFSFIKAGSQVWSEYSSTTTLFTVLIRRCRTRAAALSTI